MSILVSQKELSELRLSVYYRTKWAGQKAVARDGNGEWVTYGEIPRFVKSTKPEGEYLGCRPLHLQIIGKENTPICIDLKTGELTHGVPSEEY